MILGLIVLTRAPRLGLFPPFQYCPDANQPLGHVPALTRRTMA